MSVRVLATLTTLVTTAGCGDNATPATTNGSRLAVRELVYEDGTHQLDRSALRDLLREEDCAPQRWTDGNRYCTPTTGETTFVDAQCLTKVGIVPRDGPVAYAMDTGIDGLIAKLYARGPAYVGASALTWRLDAGRCVGPFAAPPDATYFQLGDLVTHEAFARVKHSSPHGSERLRVVDETSEDGLWVPTALFDADLAIECAPRAAASGTLQCAPVSKIAANYFGDDACTRQVAMVQSIALPDAIELDDQGTLRDFALGEPLTTTHLWTLTGCVQIDAQPGSRTFALGHELALADVPRNRVGTSRIQLIELGPSLVDVRVYDSVLGVECAPDMVDGNLRCLPEARSAAIFQRYSDGLCRIPVSVAYLPVTARAIGYIRDPEGLWHPVGPSPAEPVYEHPLGSPCSPAEIPTGTEPRPAGAAVASSTFALVTSQLLGD